MSATLTITGNVGADPELKFTPSGDAVVNFSVADTPRRFNQDTKQWEDAGETLWVRVAAWREKAEAIAHGVNKGDRVTVVGRLKQRTWQDNNGVDRVSIECDADAVAVVPRSPSSSSGNRPAQQGWGGGQARREQTSPPRQAPAAQQQPGRDEPPF